MRHVVFAASLAMLMCAAAEPRRATTLRLTVPKHAASAPVLMLEGLEVVAGERMTIEVLGPPDPQTKAQPVLAVSGLVGSNQRTGAAPIETMNLVVPLNDKASRLLSNSEEITLTLRLRSGRHPLKWKRAYLMSA